jgi:energy-coupling factor transport system substrate-specific component
MIVIAVAIAIPSSAILFFSLFLLTPVIAFISAPFFMFMVLKVHKRGTVFLYCFLLAVLYLISGTPYLAPWLLIAGILGELPLLGAGGYTDLKRIAISWVICTLFRGSNGMIDLWFFKNQYLASGVSMNHYLQVARYYFSAPWVLLILVLGAVGALLGAIVSAKLMRKHFVRTGLLK